MGKEFRKRGGTTNEGIEYENLSIANIVLKLVNNPDVKNFHISSNDEKFGAFDDVVVEVEMESGIEIYAFQLKHNDRGNLAPVKLISRKGDFSISKYFESFQITKNAAQKYILFTNLKFSVEDNTLLQLEGEDFSVGISKFYLEDAFKISEKTDYCYKFHVVKNKNFENSLKIQEYQNFFNSFYLYVNQDNSHQLKLNTSQKFKEMFLSNETEFSNYLNIIFEWAKQKGVKEMVDKRWMQRAIALQLFSSRIEPIVESSVNEQMKIMRKAISTFDVTTVEEASCEKMKKLWGDVRFEVDDIKEANKVRQKYNLGIKSIKSWNDVDDSLRTKLLWLTGKCPLIVRDSPTVQKAIEMCLKEKFVLLVDKYINRERKNKRVFRHLSDLEKETVVYNHLIQGFTYSLQEKEECTLEDLIVINEEFVGNITVDTLVQMFEGPIYIGGAKEVLPDPYIPRILLNNVIDCKYLENIEENALIIIYCVSAVKDMKKKFSQYKFIDFDTFLDQEDNREEEKDDQVNNFKRLPIYVSNNDYRADYFPKLCEKIEWKQNCHQFRLRSDENLEWIQSKENIGALEKFRLLEWHPVEEESLWNSQLPNNINLIISDPGMGKTELLKNFKNNYFDSNVWTVIINPRDAYAFCERTNKIDAFRKFIFEDKFKNVTEFERDFFKMAWQENRIIFVWDALDEIPSDLLDSVVIIIMELAKKNVFQLVTSRSHLRKLLEDTFSVLSSSLNQFSEREQLFYLQQRLGDINSKEEIAEIKEKIKRTFALFEHKDILGIPLQIFMLTELFRQNKDKYVELLNHTFALTDIYYYFIEEKFNIYFTKIEKQILKSHMKHFSNILKSGSLEYYENLALKTLYSREILSRMSVDKEFSTEIKSTASGVGIITGVNEAFRFLHHSFAEFLAALYFSKNLHLKHFFLTTIFDEKYVNVRFFFDLLLAKNSPPHIAVLYRNYDFLEQNGEIHTFKDEGGRSVLHIFCSWGRRYTRLKVEKKEEYYFIDDEQNFHLHEDEKYLDLLNYLLRKCQPSEKDGLFGITPLTYAQKSNCFIVALNILYKHNQNILKICDASDAINILYYSATLGYDYAIECVDTKNFPVIKTIKNNHSLLHLAVSHKNFIFKLLETDAYKQFIDIENQKERTPLYVACENGNLETVKYLIQSGAKINHADTSGCTPLFVASQKGHKEIVELLIKNGAEVDLTNENGVTPLAIASRYGHLEVVEFLIISGAKVNHADTSGVTPLYTASENGSEEIVKLLIEHGAKIDLANANGFGPVSKAFGAKINQPDADGFTPLFVAAQDGHLEIVKVLIKGGCEVDLANQEGSTPLWIACAEGHLEVVKFLIATGAKVNHANTSGSTPLFVASQMGHEEIVTLLIKSGSEIDFPTEDRTTPLMVASLSGHIKVVELLITSGAKINQTDTNGFTSLYVASQESHLEIVKLLIERGAEIDLPNHEGFTPLSVASGEDCLEVVEFLVASGAKVNHTNTYGGTPLFAASQMGREETVTLLIKSGSQIDLPTEDGTTPLLIASQSGHLKVIQVLITSGANVNHVDTTGFTPLFVASQEGHLEVVKILIKSGAKVDLPNTEGSTPLLIASGEGHLDVVKFLTESGANVNHASIYGMTPLFAASENGHLEIVTFLVNSGSKIDLPITDGTTPLSIASQNGHLKVVNFLIASDKVSTADTNDLTPLYVASEKGHLTIVQLLIKSGAEIDLAQEDGSTPLWTASFHGHLKVVEFLIASGAKVNQANTSGFTPLYVACQNGYLEVVTLLIENGSESDLSVKDGTTPLFAACYHAHFKVVECLITSGAKVNHANAASGTPLHVASHMGHLEIVKLLTKYGADIDLANEEGSTPLYAASGEGHFKVAQFLISSGAKVKHGDTSGLTPLHVASQMGREEIVTLLIKCGAEIDLPSEDGTTSLSIASEEGHLKIVEFLITSGAKVNHADTSGLTPLYLASQMGREKIVKLLVTCGAEMDLHSQDDSTPLWIAAEKGHLKVVELLIASGAKINLANRFGLTPLDVALQNGHNKIVKVLKNQMPPRNRFRQWFRSAFSRPFKSS